MPNIKVNKITEFENRNINLQNTKKNYKIAKVVNSF